MKRRLLVGLGVFTGLLVLLVVGLVAYAKSAGNPTFTFPNTGLVASTDPAVIAEGEYLFHGPMHCTACHDTSKAVAFDRKPGERVEPLGGMEWDMGPIGRPVSGNLTSDKATGLGGRTDEHIARVLKHGVGEDGKLRIFMALAVAPMTDREIVALLSYMRSLPPKEHEVREEEVGFLGQLLIAFGTFQPKFLPAATPVPAGAEPDVKRGEYLATGPALCAACHSPYDFMDGMKLKGDLFSGCFAAEAGHEDPSQELCPPNLTPHAGAHLDGWDEERFVARLRGGVFTSRDSTMPWVNFSNMTEIDVRSIYRYLRTLPPSARNPGPPVRPVGSFTMPKG